MHRSPNTYRPVKKQNKTNPQQKAQPTTQDLTFATTPNFLTLLRIAFVPIVVSLLFLKETRWDVLAGILFAVASITDYLDGYLARIQQNETIYGKLMDPLADKFLIISALIILQDLGRVHPVVVMLLICREMAITGLRALASAEGIIIPASRSAKWKTATQMVAMPMIMARSGVYGLPLESVGSTLLYLSLGISLWSANSYIVSFFQKLKASKKNTRNQ
jgi:CDP-diacylglycerol--glycerol-3-phosphate 3-phosphatidyltransferase